ncbi:MAG: hypothetical protein JKY65_26440 [Planctomycetes bacterium]|nr:hypothetical protein [Planctomycetota bacterium]
MSKKDSQIAPGAAPEKTKKTALTLAIGVPITTLLLVLVIQAGLRASWRGDVEQTLADLSAEGVGIENLYPSPPPENGADDLHKAAKLLEDAFSDDISMMRGARPQLLASVHRDPESESKWAVYEPLRSDSPPDVAGAVAVVLAKLEQVDPLLESGLKKEIVYRAGWEKGFEAELDWLMEIKELIQVLEIRVGWRMIQGDPEGAYRDLDHCLALAESLSAPSVVGRLVQIAVTLSCLEMLEDLLAMGDAPKERSFSKLLKRLESLQKAGGLTASLRGELYAFSVMTDDPDVIAKSGDAMSKASTSLLWGRWRAQHVALMAELIRASRKPPAEFDEYIRDFEARVIQDANPLSRLLLPALAKLQLKERKIQARLRLATRALRLARRKELPKSVRDMPADPFTFDAKPCRYRREGQGALLWSVGEDGRDANGKADPERDGGPDDVSFRLLRK